nr:hydroxyethylthiazole kinase [FCB group bacterium]
ENPFDAALGGIIALGIAGENAAELCSGPGTFVPHFLDSLAALDNSVIMETTKAEML